MSTSDVPTVASAGSWSPVLVFGAILLVVLGVLYALRKPLVELCHAAFAAVVVAVHSVRVTSSACVCNGYVWRVAPGKLVNGKGRCAIAARCRESVCGPHSVCSAHADQIAKPQPECKGWHIPDDALRVSHDVVRSQMVDAWSSVMAAAVALPTKIYAGAAARARKLAIVFGYIVVMTAIRAGVTLVVTFLLYAMLLGVAWRLLVRSKGVKRAAFGVLVAIMLLTTFAPLVADLPVVSVNVSRHAQAYAAATCDPTQTAVVGLVDSGSTNHITNNEDYLVNIHSRERASLEGVGSTVTTAVGDAMAVFPQDADWTAFTKPKLLTNTLCARQHKTTRCCLRVLSKMMVCSEIQCTDACSFRTRSMANRPTLCH
jgi:hypothetical protein